MTTTYSARGTAIGVGGSYGTLIQGAWYAADGLVQTRLYGDAANTIAGVQYDLARRPWHIDIARNAPASWTAQPSQIANLEALTYTYDRWGIRCL